MRPRGAWGVMPPAGLGSLRLARGLFGASGSSRLIAPALIELKRPPSPRDWQGMVRLRGHALAPPPAGGVGSFQATRAPALPATRLPRPTPSLAASFALCPPSPHLSNLSPLHSTLPPQSDPYLCPLPTSLPSPHSRVPSSPPPPPPPPPAPAAPPPLPTTMPSVSVSTRQCRSLHSKAPCSGQGCLIHFPQDRDAIRRSISADRIADGLVPAGLAGLAIEQWASSPSKPGGARGVGGRGYQSTGVEGYKKVGRDELMVCRQSPDRTAGSDGGRPC